MDEEGVFRLVSLGCAELRALRDPGNDLRVSPKRLALLSYLVLARPRGFHRRDILLTLFWADSGARRARNALNQTLYALRRILGPDTLISRGHEEVGIDRLRISSDALDFEDAITAGSWRSAVEAYGGDLLRGVNPPSSAGFERWLDGERLRYRRMARDAASELAAAERRAGHLGEAARWLDYGLGLVPTDETLLRSLLRTLMAAGDRGDAVDAYRRFARHLDSEFGVEPGERTRALMDAVLAGDPLEPPRSLPAPSSAANGDADPGLAVLPLQSLADDPDLRYFASGLTETLIAELARCLPSRVISHQSVARFAGSPRPLGEIARELGVASVLEGAVLRIEDRIRITLQLVRTDPERHLWAGAFDGTMRNVLALQRRIASDVTREVARSFGTELVLRDGVPGEVDPAAYDAFLRGIVSLGVITPTSFREVLAHFRRSAELDPTFADAWAWIAFTWTLGGQLGVSGFIECRAAAAHAIQRALALAPEQGSVHAIHANVLLFYHRDRKGAWRAAERAFERGGGDIRSYVPLVMPMAALGRFDEAEDHARRAIRVNPLGGPEHLWLGWVLLRARRFEEAVEQLEWTASKWPLIYVAEFLAQSHLFAGRPAVAVEISRAAVTAPCMRLALGYHAATLARGGASPEAAAVLERLRSAEEDGPRDPFPLATALAGLGSRDEMLQALRRMRDEGSVNGWMVDLEPFFDPYRDDPEFAELARTLREPGGPPPPASSAVG